MTNPHAEWLRKLADGIRDVLSPSEYQRLKFCAEMLEALDGRPAEPSVQPPQTAAEMDLESACNWVACFADSESPIIRTYVKRLLEKLQPRAGTLAGDELRTNPCAKET